jgi:hypothetical protein
VLADDKGGLVPRDQRTEPGDDRDQRDPSASPRPAASHDDDGDDRYDDHGDDDHGDDDHGDDDHGDDDHGDDDHGDDD